MISIIILDYHNLVRKGMVMILNTIKDYRVIGHTDSRDEMLLLIKDKNPSVILLDINAHPACSMDLAIEILKINPSQAIIATSSVNRPQYLKKIFLSGIKGYITKQAGLHELQQAIQCSVKGEVYFDECFAEYLNMIPGSWHATA